MGWTEHLRKHISEREEARLHIKCQILEAKADPSLSDVQRKKALDDFAKEAVRLDKLIQALIAAQDGEPSG